jgi:hypothetical protein
LGQNDRTIIIKRDVIIKTKFINEIDLILECLQEETKYHNITKKIATIDDWNNFIDLAYSHGVLPVVYKNLKLFLEYLPEDIFDRLKSDYKYIAKQNMLMSAELINITKLFEKNNITALSFKGPVLSSLAYGDILLRQYADLDILINEKDLYDVAQLLLDNGYFTDVDISVLKNKIYLNIDNDFSFFTKSGIHIELHWKLFREKIGLNIEFASYVNDKNEVYIHKQKIKTLANEALLVYLCIHGSKHAWERLEWINDIHMLLLHVDIHWPKVIKIAKEMDADISLYLGLYIVKNIFNVALPNDIDNKINTLYIEDLANDVYKFINNNLLNDESYMSYQQIKLFQSKLLNTYKKKFDHFLFHYVFITKNDYLAFPLPPYLTWLYYVIKPFRIIFKQIAK